MLKLGLKLMEILMISVIKRYSEISRSHELLIDNYNSALDKIVLCERVQFMPIYRVYSRNRNGLGSIADERFYLDSASAFKYWSEVLNYKGALF